MRWHGSTSNSRWFSMLYALRMVMHAPIQWVTLAENPSMRLQMTIHHIISFISYGGGLYFGRCQYFAVLAGNCEMTNVFLNTVFLVKAFVPPARQGAPVAAAGLLLVVSFVFCRLLLFPFWLWTYFTDLWYYPEVSWDQVTTAELLFYPTTVIGVFILSLFWMKPLIKGVKKAFGFSSGEGARESWRSRDE